MPIIGPPNAVSNIPSARKPDAELALKTVFQDACQSLPQVLTHQLRAGKVNELEDRYVLSVRTEVRGENVEDVLQSLPCPEPQRLWVMLARLSDRPIEVIRKQLGESGYTLENVEVCNHRDDRTMLITFVISFPWDGYLDDDGAQRFLPSSGVERGGDIPSAEVARSLLNLNRIARECYEAQTAPNPDVVGFAQRAATPRGISPRELEISNKKPR